MDKQAIYLREYELTQQNLDSTRSHYWQVFGIFMPVNTAAFGGIIYSIVSGVHDVWLLTLLFAFVIIPLTCFLTRYLNRVSSIIHGNYRRLQEIEKELGMYTHLMINDLDKDWNDLSKEEQERLRWAQGKHSRPSGQKDAIWVLRIYVLLWLACVGLAFAL